MELPAIARVWSTVGFQPDIVPSSVAKMKRLGPETPPSVTTKPLVPLKTLPVGAELVPPAGGGMVTTSGDAPGDNGLTGVPFPSYRVDTPVPLSEIHQGLVELCDRPQGLTRFES